MGTISPGRSSFCRRLLVDMLAMSDFESGLDAASLGDKDQYFWAIRRSQPVQVGRRVSYQLVFINLR